MKRWQSGAPFRPFPSHPRPLQAVDYINTTESTSCTSERRTQAPDPPGATESPGGPRGSHPHKHCIAAAPSRAFRAGRAPSGEATGTGRGSEHRPGAAPGLRDRLPPYITPLGSAPFPNPRKLSQRDTRAPDSARLPPGAASRRGPPTAPQGAGAARPTRGRLGGGGRASVQLGGGGRSPGRTVLRRTGSLKCRTTASVSRCVRPLTGVPFTSSSTSPGAGALPESSTGPGAPSPPAGSRPARYGNSPRSAPPRSRSGSGPAGPPQDTTHSCTLLSQCRFFRRVLDMPQHGATQPTPRCAAPAPAAAAARLRPAAPPQLRLAGPTPPGSALPVSTAPCRPHWPRPPGLPRPGHAPGAGLPVTDRAVLGRARPARGGACRRLRPSPAGTL